MDEFLHNPILHYACSSLLVENNGKSNTKSDVAVCSLYDFTVLLLYKLRVSLPKLCVGLKLYVSWLHVSCSCKKTNSTCFEVEKSSSLKNTGLEFTSDCRHVTYA